MRFCIVQVVLPIILTVLGTIADRLECEQFNRDILEFEWERDLNIVMLGDSTMRMQWECMCLDVTLEVGYSQHQYSVDENPNSTKHMVETHPDSILKIATQHLNDGQLYIRMSHAQATFEEFLRHHSRTTSPFMKRPGGKGGRERERKRREQRREEKRREIHVCNFKTTKTGKHIRFIYGGYNSEVIQIMSSKLKHALH